MKRKKWSEMEEQTLLSKYSELFESGVLSKLKTREKKFKPISDHVNSLHHLGDPISFPFKWTWRDVSIKIQNMRHQYLGVKQKIRVSENEFNWSDGENHWVNFLKYKEVFGDIELSESTTITTVKDKKFGEESIISDVLGLGYTVETGDDDDDDDDEYESEIDEEAEEQEEEEEEEGIDGDFGGSDAGEKDATNMEFTVYKGRKRRLRMMKLGSKVLEIRELIVRREEKRREREWSKQLKEISVPSRNKRDESEEEEELLIEIEKMKLLCAKREAQKRMRLQKELSDERRRRMEIEQKWEEEEMEWKQRMLEMQIEHEKQMMQIQADSCQTQLQILGLVARIVCHFFGSETETCYTGFSSSRR